MDLFSSKDNHLLPLYQAGSSDAMSLSVTTSADDSPPTDCPLAHLLQGQGSTYCTCGRRNLNASHFLADADTSCPGPWSSGPEGPWPFGTFLEYSRVESLRVTLWKELLQTVANDIIAALRPVTLCQYQSCWMSFQSFLSSRSVTSVSQHTVLGYLSFLFYS